MGDIAEEIQALETGRYDAMLSGDVSTLGELLSDRLVYTHSSGYRDTKDTFLAKLADGSLRYLRVEHPAGPVVVLGDTALVTGEMRGTVEVSGQTRELGNLSLAVWTREEGRWRLIAFAPTPAR
jgi:ketosteroid isomerase-like protein